MKFIYLFLFFILLHSCNEGDKPVRNNIEFICDAEVVNGDSLRAGMYNLFGGNTRSTEFHRSGKYGIKVDESNPYSMVFVLKNVKKGDVVKATVWRHIEGEEGDIVVSADDIFYRSKNIAKERDGDWGMLTIATVIDKDYKELKIYAYNPNEKPAFFDDMKVEIFFDATKPEVTGDDLKIEISESAMDSLLMFRNLAIENDIITDESKAYVNGFIIDHEERIPISVRLKGDWTDHLESDKWSLRIKVEGNYAYKGLKTFSIQSPTTRGYMREWFAHQVFEEEDILTTSYSFIPVELNGEAMGIYALEEHFDKQLLEKRNRREGPIVKFDEAGIWQQYLQQKKSGTLWEAPTVEAAEIIPFKSNRTLKTPVLYKQFLMAKSHMQRYREHDENVNAYMDIERMAKYLALSDILNGNHGNVWHNQRFYFNPITLKLEVIAYDCFTSSEETNLPPVSLKGLETKGAKQFNLTEFLVSNGQVADRYLFYLKKYSAPEYLSKLLEKLDPEITRIEKLLRHEYPFINFENKLFKAQASEAAKLIPEYESYIPNRQMEDASYVPDFSEFPHGVLFEDIALKVYPETDNKFVLKNFHTSDLVIIGYSLKGSKKQMIPLNRHIILGKYKGSAEEIAMQLPSDTKRIFYTARNCGGKIYSANISKFPVVGIIQSMEERSDITALPFKHLGNKIILTAGNYKLNRDVIIPAGLRVEFEPGVSIDITNSACFVSFSPVFVNGNKSHPVMLKSSDNSGNGFTIITKGEMNKLHYLHVNGLQSLDKHMATLTGAVTVYDGIVDLLGCKFSDNKCEDGLNLIRCKFKMRNCSVSNAQSDGFDADFCSGNLSDSKFEYTGNDCIDFSGSQIEIINCNIRNAGDKGISGGERSDLIVRNCIIDGASIAIASKDQSNLDVYDLSVIKSSIGFAAYRKKPEYGPASIKVHSIKKINSKELHLLEKGSKLDYLDEKIDGELKLNIDSLYAKYRSAS